MILKFGKFKGAKLSETPEWYQNWLLKQDWFKQPAPAHQQLNGWGGYSKKGESIYDAIFEQEKSDMLKLEIENGDDEYLREIYGDLYI